MAKAKVAKVKKGAKASSMGTGMSHTPAQMADMMPGMKHGAKMGKGKKMKGMM